MVSVDYGRGGVYCDKEKEKIIILIVSILLGGALLYSGAWLYYYYAVCLPHRQLLVIGINQKIAIQWDFPITYEMARAYQKANGKYLRQNQWEDITLVMSLELGK